LKTRLTILLLWLTLPLSSAPSPFSWPEGAGANLVKANCLICHSGEIIVGQRLSAETWAKEVEKMSSWGSPIAEDQKATLVEYLAKNFAVDTPPVKVEKDRFKF
jgi:mono/diheme cytochrome c family protein